MLMVDLMVFRFHLKLDKFYCIGDMNLLKVICYDLFFLFFCSYKTSYYWLNRQELLEKANDKYGKEKAAEYYTRNKDVIKEKANNRHKNLTEEQNAAKRK